MEDIVNLVLIYDKIYDYEAELDFLRTGARILAQHLSGEKKLVPDEIKGWSLDSAFLLVVSIAEYYGFDLRSIGDIDPRLIQRIQWLDRAKSSRKADNKRFIGIIDHYFELLLKNAPTTAERVIDTLSNLHELFDKGIIIPRESFLPEIKNAAKATSHILEEAVDKDMEDETFLSLVSWISNEDAQWFKSFELNSQLLESSYLGIPLHLWDCDLPLLRYKYQRGAQYLPKFEKKEIAKEAFSALIPEVYSTDVPDLLKIRGTPEFSNFREEIDRVHREACESPEDFPDTKSVHEYFKNKHFSQLQKLAHERQPKPGTVLLKKLFSEVHPIIGLVIGGEELYKEYKHKYASWRFAVSTLQVKEKLKARQKPYKILRV